MELGVVVCPAGRTASIRDVKDGQVARFGRACQRCPLFERCTTAPVGRTIGLGPHERQLARGRDRQTDPLWQADYTATRPAIERKIGHLMRRRHGGRRARVRDRAKVNADFNLLAAAVNLARLATLGVTSHPVPSPPSPEAPTGPRTRLQTTLTTPQRDELTPPQARDRADHQPAAPQPPPGPGAKRPDQSKTGDSHQPPRHRRAPEPCVEGRRFSRVARPGPARPMCSSPPRAGLSRLAQFLEARQVIAVDRLLLHSSGGHAAAVAASHYEQPPGERRGDDRVRPQRTRPAVASGDDSC